MTDTSMKHPSQLTSGDFTAAEEPFALFADWFAEAVAGEPNDPNAMALATVDPDGLPGCHLVSSWHFCNGGRKGPRGPRGEISSASMASGYGRPSGLVRRGRPSPGASFPTCR